MPSAARGPPCNSRAALFSVDVLGVQNAELLGPRTTWAFHFSYAIPSIPLPGAAVVCLQELQSKVQAGEMPQLPAHALQAHLLQQHQHLQHAAAAAQGLPMQGMSLQWGEGVLPPGGPSASEPGKCSWAGYCRASVFRQGCLASTGCEGEREEGLSDYALVYLPWRCCWCC